MTVSTETNHNEYTGNGVTVAFPYTFRVFKKSDLVVFTSANDGEDIKILRVDTDYTVTGAGGFRGGNVVLKTPLASGVQISISRELPATQETDLRNQGKFFPEVHEDAFDKLTMLIQQIRSSFSLALRKPSFLANYYDAMGNYIRNLRDPSRPQDAATKSYVDKQIAGNTEGWQEADNKLNEKIDGNHRRTLRVSDIDIHPLPSAQERAEKVLSFDRNGKPVVVAPASGSAVDVLNQLAASNGSLVGLEHGKLNDAIDYITPEMFGANGTPEGDTKALKSILAKALDVPVKIIFQRMYQSLEPLSCYFVQTHNQGITIDSNNSYCGISFLCESPENPLIDIHGYNINILSMRIVNLKQSRPIGLRVCGDIARVKCVTTRGVFSKAVLGIAVLRGEFGGFDIKITPDDKPGEMAILRGVGVQLVACVNTDITGSSSILRTEHPTVHGLLSGETTASLKPPSYTQDITWGVEGCDIYGIKAIASQKGPFAHGLLINFVGGCVFDFCRESFVTLGGQWISFNGAWFGTQALTPPGQEMFRTTGPGIAYAHFNNCTLDGGQSDVKTQQFTMTAAFSSYVNNNHNAINVRVVGTNNVTCHGNIPSITNSTPDVTLIDPSVNNIFMPIRGKARFTNGIHIGKSGGVTDAKQLIRIDSGERGIELSTATGTIIGTTSGGLPVRTITPANNAVLYLGSMEGSGRSISSNGTINANGQDYAEYMLKSNSCGIINAGDICGIDQRGLLTDSFDEAISFVIKSTNPAYVGGAVWGASLPYPVKPEIVDIPNVTAETSEDDIKSISLVEIENQRLLNAWSDDVAEWELRYEKERIKYDRIAFSGQVPCNVHNSEPGDYIVATRNNDGSILGVPVKNPSIGEYMASVGRVWSVMQDGRSWVAIKIS